jgi:hypothetical protein
MAPSLLAVQDLLGALGWRALPPRGPVGPGGAAVFAGSMATASSEAWTEATRELPLPEGARGERHGRSVVQSVRLPAEEFAEIERIAAQAGVPVGALIRGWVLAGLAAER